MFCQLCGLGCFELLNEQVIAQTQVSRVLIIGVEEAEPKSI